MRRTPAAPARRRSQDDLVKVPRHQNVVATKFGFGECAGLLSINLDCRKERLVSPQADRRTDTSPPALRHVPLLVLSRALLQHTDTAEELKSCVFNLLCTYGPRSWRGGVRHTRCDTFDTHDTASFLHIACVKTFRMVVNIHEIKLAPGGMNEWQKELRVLFSGRDRRPSYRSGRSER